MAQFTGSLLFAIADAASITFPDQQMQDFFELWGWTVTLISDEDSDLDSDSFLEGFDVVAYSESCSSATLGSSGDTAAVPIISFEPGQWDDLRLTAGHSAGEDTDNIRPTALHESMGGFAGSGNDNNTNIVTTSKDLRYSNDAVVGGSGGIELAVTQNVRTTFAAWETGDALNTSTAPARRLLNGIWRISPSAPDESVSPGFVNNDIAWVMLASQLEWLAGNDPLTVRQIAFPITEITRTGGWSANAPTDIDDVTPVTSSVYTVNATGVLVFRLGILTDPQNNALHHLVMAFRRSVSSGTLAGTMGFHRNYVSEGSQGTEVTTVAIHLDAQLDWSGDAIMLTEAEIDTIVGSEYTDDLYVRFNITTRTSPAEGELSNFRFIVDGAPDAPDGGLLPIYRRNVYHQPRRRKESQVFA